MSTHGGASPLSYRRIARPDLAVVGSLELDTEQVRRFLGPLADIVDAVRHGLAHSMIGVEVSGEFAGFYVIHPDVRDHSCWWLGWFAIDRRRQGCGYGRAVMTAIMERLRCVDGCRRVRLLVSPENARALALYREAGFRRVDVLQKTGELIMEHSVVGCGRGGVRVTRAAQNLSIHSIHAGPGTTRVCSAARVRGAIHGPPNALQDSVCGRC